MSATVSVRFAFLTRINSSRRIPGSNYPVCGVLKARNETVSQLGNICHKSCSGRNPMTLRSFGEFTGHCSVNWFGRFYSGPTAACWNCSGAVSRSALLCDSCDAVQPVPEGDYFSLLGLSRRFDLDIALLTKAFRQLQGRLHPDKFAAKSEREQQLSSECSSLLNVAYQTLHSPYSRGCYLLRLHGRDVEDEASASSSAAPTDPKLLAEVMEINEALADERLDEKQLQRMDEDNRRTVATVLPQLVAAFERGDLVSAEAMLARLKYFANIEAKIKSLELKFNVVH